MKIANMIAELREELNLIDQKIRSLELLCLEEVRLNSMIEEGSPPNQIQ